MVANEQNLKKITTTSEARKKGRAGGKKSGEVRRQKKLLRELLEEALEFKTDTGTLSVDITRSLINEALAGNVKAYEVIRDTLGQKPKDKLGIELNPKATAILESINKQVGGKK